MTDTKTQAKAYAVDFEDLYGSRVRVLGSSLARQPAVWIFTDGPATSRTAAAHLSVEQARTVRDALDRFVTEHAAACEESER